MGRFENLGNVSIGEDVSDNWNGKHVLKIKSEKLRFVTIADAGNANDEKSETPESLRQEIEPWLTALFQSEHLSLLIGTGLTSAVSFMAGASPAGMSRLNNLTTFQKEIDKSSRESAQKTGRGEPNIEDDIRVANSLIAGLEIYLSSEDNDSKQNLSDELKQFKKELKEGIDSFSKDVLDTENSIVTSDEITKTTGYLVSFLVSFCSRTAQRERLNLFTTIGLLNSGPSLLESILSIVLLETSIRCFDHPG